MKILRLLPLCLLSSIVACAGKCVPPDDGPAEVGEGVKPEDEGKPEVCTDDADCVPEQCCHPTSCVPASQAPDCTDVVCTLECQPGTMDCGQGYCACQAGVCTAIIEDGEPL
jgi:hypothetical protein